LQIIDSVVKVGTQDLPILVSGSAGPLRAWFIGEISMEEPFVAATERPRFIPVTINALKELLKTRRVLNQTTSLRVERFDGAIRNQPCIAETLHRAGPVKPDDRVAD
jgi:hypothetical protein